MQVAAQAMQRVREEENASLVKQLQVSSLLHCTGCTCSRAEKAHVLLG